MNKYVAGLAFHKDDYNLVALIEKQRPTWQKGKMNGIGGKVEEKESPIEAMIREFEEETGYKSIEQDWNNFTTLIGSDWMVRFYRSFSIDLNLLKTTTDEKVQIVRVSSLKLKKTEVIENLKWLIPMALDTQFHYASITYG